MFALGRGNRVPLSPNAPLPLRGVGRVVGHDVQLTLVLTKAGHDAAGGFPTVDGPPRSARPGHRACGTPASGRRCRARARRARRFHRSNTDCGTAPCTSRWKPDPLRERRRAKASSVAAPIAMWSGCPKMPSGPNVTTTAGSSSSRIRATAETTSSKGTSATPPSGRPSHSWRSGTRPSARHAASSSPWRMDPSVSRVAGNPSRRSPCSPDVAWIKTNLKSGSSACSATLPAAPYASSSGCAKTQARVRFWNTTQSYRQRGARPGQTWRLGPHPVLAHRDPHAWVNP